MVSKRPTQENSFSCRDGGCLPRRLPLRRSRRWGSDPLREGDGHTSRTILLLLSKESLLGYFMLSRLQHHNGNHVLTATLTPSGSAGGEPTRPGGGKGPGCAGTRERGQRQKEQGNLRKTGGKSWVVRYYNRVDTSRKMILLREWFSWGAHWVISGTIKCPLFRWAFPFATRNWTLPYCWCKPQDGCPCTSSTTLSYPCSLGAASRRGRMLRRFSAGLRTKS